MGETPYDYVARVRLELAVHFLWYFPKLSLTEISYRCGFSSPSHFSRAISQHFHSSPRELRKKGIHYHLQQQDSKNMQVYGEPSTYNKVEDDDASHTVRHEHVQLETLGPFNLNVSLEVKGYELSELQSSWNTLAKISGERMHFIGVPMDNPFITPKEKCRYLCGVVLQEDFHTANYVIKQSEALTITLPKKDISRDIINSYYYELYNTFPTLFDVETVWDYPFEFVYLEEDSADQMYKAMIHKICIPVRKINHRKEELK